MIRFGSKHWAHFPRMRQYSLMASTIFSRCLHGSPGGPRRGEVPHLPVVKKYLPSHATRGTQREVKNAIARSHVTYFSKEVLALTIGGSRFDFFAYLFRGTFLCFDEAAFSCNVVVAGRTSVWLRWLAWLSNFTLNCRQYFNFISVFGGEIVQITRLARSGCQVVLICHVFWRAEVQWFDYPVRRVTSFCSFYMENLTPLKRITRTGWPGNQPWWGTPPHMWTRSRKKERLNG